jgi:hypothetical protein
MLVPSSASVEYPMSRAFIAYAVAFMSVACASSIAAAQSPQAHTMALTMKLDQMVEQLPAGRYHVRKSVIDAQGMPVGQPLRDDHICIKKVGQIAGAVSNYATTFDLSRMAWKGEGAVCKSAYNADDTSTMQEIACATTDKMDPPSRWNVLEADPKCKTTYTETSRERSCSDVSMTRVVNGTKEKRVSSNHYLSGAILTPGKSLRLHLREFDTSATATKYIAGHAVLATLVSPACDPADRPAQSVTD